ncbi:MAG: chorismate-binding protein [Phreatobacter sp.]
MLRAKPDFDPVAAAEQLGGGTAFLFQRFDLMTRRLIRTVVGLEVEIVGTHDFAGALRMGLDRPGGDASEPAPVLVFAGFEALLGKPPGETTGLPGHLVARVREGFEIDHASGRLRLISADEQALRGRLQALSPADARVSDRVRRADLSDWTADRGFNDYARRVETIKRVIAAGGAEGAVLSLGLSKVTEANPFALYRAFVAANPSPYGFVLNHDGKALVGSSPLAYLTARQGRLHLETDAGTRPVTGDAILDDAAARDLMVNPKDAAEHRVVVEAEREALMPIAKDGAVEAVIDRQVRRFSHVMHLYSALEAELSHGLDMTDAILALAPAAAVSGRPKRVAAELGLTQEGGARGAYGGVIGIVEPGLADLAVVIRSLWISEGRAHLRVGGKIVATSTAEEEYREALSKARFLIDGVARAEARGR